MLTSSTQLQNTSFHVVERTTTSSKCQKMKNARAKRAKILFFIVKYANLWGFCYRRRRDCLSSLVSHRETQSEGYGFVKSFKPGDCAILLISLISLKGESALCKLNEGHCQAQSSPRKRA